MSLVATAIHEAGHAVAAILLRQKFKYATICPNEDSLGRVMLLVSSPRSMADRAIRRRLQRDLILAVAGPIAEALYEGSDSSFELSDFNEVCRLLEPFEADSEKILRNAVCKTYRLLAEPCNMARLAAVASGLLEHKILSWHQVKRMCDGCST